MPNKYYTDLRIPVYNFHKILETNDLKYLWISDPEEIDLSNVWQDIYNQYCKESNIDNTILINIARVEYLKEEHFRIEKLIDILDENVFQSVTEKVKKSLYDKFGYKYNEKISLQENVSRFRKALESKLMHIHLQEQKIPREENKQGKNLIREIVSLQRVTDIKIDVYKDTMEYYLAVWKEAHEIIAVRKKQQR